MKQDNELNLTELGKHIETLKSYLDKYKNLPDDVKSKLENEILFWENKLNEYA